MGWKERRRGRSRSHARNRRWAAMHASAAPEPAAEPERQRNLIAGGAAGGTGYRYAGKAEPESPAMLSRLTARLADGPPLPAAVLAHRATGPPDSLRGQDAGRSFRPDPLRPPAKMSRRAGTSGYGAALVARPVWGTEGRQVQVLLARPPTNTPPTAGPSENRPLCSPPARAVFFLAWEKWGARDGRRARAMASLHPNHAIEAK